MLLFTSALPHAQARHRRSAWPESKIVGLQQQETLSLQQFSGLQQRALPVDEFKDASGEGQMFRSWTLLSRVRAAAACVRHHSSLTGTCPPGDTATHVSTTH